MKLLLCLSALATSLVAATGSYDQSAALAAERMTLTSEWAGVQAAIKNAKTTAQSDAAQQRMSDFATKVLALRDKTAAANANLISILSGQPGYPFSGDKDSSATIKATYLKLVPLNANLKSLSFTASPPYQPKDINALQILLDRTKTAIDEHRHASQNIATRLAQLRR